MKRLLLVFLLACGDDAPADAVDAALDDSFMGCPADVPALALQAQAHGSAITATVTAASRVPARRYLNDWTFRFTDAAGAPANVTVTSARTWMPVHGHDGLVMPQIVPGGEGQVELRGLNFNMRGPWEVQLAVSSAAGADAIVFHVCIAE